MGEYVNNFHEDGGAGMGRSLFYFYIDINTYEDYECYCREGLKDMVESETTYINLGCFGILSKSSKTSFLISEDGLMKMTATSNLSIRLMSIISSNTLGSRVILELFLWTDFVFFVNIG